MKFCLEKNARSWACITFWRVNGILPDSGLLLSKTRVTRSYTTQISKKKTATVTEEMGLCSAHIDLDPTNEQQTRILVPHAFRNAMDLAEDAAAKVLNEVGSWRFNVSSGHRIATRDTYRRHGSEKEPGK